MLQGQRAWLASALAATAVALLVVWLAWVLLHTPRTFDNVWGFAPDGRGFSVLSPSQPASWTTEASSAAMRGAFLLLWVAWGAAMAIALGTRLSPRPAALVGATVVAAAVACVPPMLSRDLFGYVAYGRVSGLHGLDPYVNGRDALARLGDPAAAFIVWDTPLPYGPLWVLVAGGFAWLGQWHGLWLEVLLHKGLAGASLVAGALAASHRAARDRAGAVVLAICLNPLLLIESGGSGHNDATMTALMVVAARLGGQGRHVAAALSLGLAISIKPIVIAAVPLMLVARWRDGVPLGRLSILALAAVAPPLCLAMLVTDIGSFAAAVLARASAGPERQVGLVLATLGAAVAVGWYQIGQSDERPRDWLLAWVPLAAVLAVLVVQIRFPWYMTWALMPALATLDRRAVPWLAMCSTIGFALMWQYSFPR